MTAHVLSTSVRYSLEALSSGGRIPLEVSLQLAYALAKYLDEAHTPSGAIGPFDTRSITVDASGQLRVAATQRSDGRAPELVDGAVPDILSDLYSLGVVFYRLLTGLREVDATRPAGGALVPPSRFNPGISEDLDGLVLSMLDDDPAQRPYRLAQVLAVLAASDLEPSLQPVATWVASVRPTGTTASAPRQRRPAVRWIPDVEPAGEELDERDEDPGEGPLRFDAWAAASALVVAMGIALIVMT